MQCDIKPQNSVVNKDPRPGLVPKIADFSIMVSTGKVQETATPVYRTRDLQVGPAAPKREVFAFVLMVYELYHSLSSGLVKSPLGLLAWRGNQFVAPEEMATLDNAVDLKGGGQGGHGKTA